MIDRVVLLCAAVLMLASMDPAHAQVPKKIPRVGVLSEDDTASTISPREEAFRQGLRELGYKEGENIVIEKRSSEGGPGRMEALAAELVQRRVDVILTTGTTATQAARRATDTIPVVMTFVSDPVESGFVASLARPGGNITGLTNLGPELSGKWLELLKEMVPRLHGWVSSSIRPHGRIVFLLKR